MINDEIQKEYRKKYNLPEIKDYGFSKEHNSKSVEMIHKVLEWFKESKLHNRSVTFNIPLILIFPIIAHFSAFFN